MIIGATVTGISMRGAMVTGIVIVAIGIAMTTGGAVATTGMVADGWRARWSPVRWKASSIVPPLQHIATTKRRREWSIVDLTG